MAIKPETIPAWILLSGAFDDHVFMRIGKHEVVYAVIGSVGVPVVNNFVSAQRSSEMPFHDQSMLKDVTTNPGVWMVGHLAKDITIAIRESAAVPATIQFQRPGTFAFVFSGQMMPVVLMPVEKANGASLAQYSRGNTLMKDCSPTATTTERGFRLFGSSSHVQSVS